ncbi:MAG: DUF192 domain-containing protein [Chlorobi bacterium]|nr:DUF192 domain-containing protein [Chlorobiota bacterium]
MIKRSIWLLSGLMLLGMWQCGNGKEKQKKLDREVGWKIDSHGKFYRGDSLVASFDLETSDTEYKRTIGLMYRKHMNDNQAMLFVFPDEQPRYFWMHNTYLPLDIIFLDKNRKIVSVQKNAKPLNDQSLPSGQPAQYVLEIKGGLYDRLGLRKGDSLAVSK